MVSPVLRRDAVRWARTAYRVSERRACRVLGVARSTVRYRSVRRSDDILRRRLRELAGVRVSYGYRQLHTLLRREGWPVNAKRVYRLYREEGAGAAPEETEAAPECGDPRAELCAESSERALGDGFRA